MSSPEKDGAETNPLETQVGGDHYKRWSIQPLEFCMVNKLDHCQSNIIKYTMRFRDKAGLEDLKKAKHYVELLAKIEYNEII